ncbi:MAG TPA: ROK family protein [Saprospiraceae bacterium]|nr:ROK family protein [Saprospiraceae bacterium]HND87993.1 ROK family protein [Saprospiraceae bacterium]
MVLGIDVGASGIKGAMVDLDKGKLSGERFRVPTPHPSTPSAMAAAVAEITEFFAYKGIVGCGFPSIVKNGTALSAANIDPAWVGTNIEQVFAQATGCQFFVTNDADAAGVAEMRYGVGQGENGLVFLITIGTGLGSALFYKGVLVPNTELGHLMWRNGKSAELYASSGARERLKISRKEWAERFNEYLVHMERLFSPDLFILGGGESKFFEQYKDQLHTQARVVPAKLLNNAGIIGAAAYAMEATR